MLPWEQLTERGRLRRLRAVANTALGDYALTPRRLRLVGGFTNAIYRADCDEGTFAVRVELEFEHPDQDYEVELAWLQALARTDIPAVRPVPTRSGGWFVKAGAAGVPGDRRCTVFDWVPGGPLDDRPQPAAYRELGRLSARLHRHGAGFRAPTEPMRWDRVFYWPEEYDPVVVFGDAWSARFGGGGRLEVLRRAVEISGSAFGRLDPSGAQIIHGDLHRWNVHVYRGSVIALDFADVMLGHPVQDVAITLFYEQEGAAAVRREQFEAGYREVGNWPVAYEGELEHFMAARTLSFVNYMANLEDDPGDYYDRAFPRLEAYLDEWDR